MEHSSHKKFKDDTVNEAELFRKIDDIFKCDNRTHNDPEGYLKLLHKLISAVTLNQNVPSKVYINFDTARNSLLYAHFCYRLSTPAVLFALATLEMALVLKGEIEEHKFGKYKGLGTKLSVAFEKKWILIEDIKHPFSRETCNYDVDSIIKLVTHTRDELAHHPEYLNSPHMNIMYFALVADIINSMFGRD